MLSIMLLRFVIALSVIPWTLASIGPSADLYIVNKRIAPDGFMRSAVLAGNTKENATFPGPVITGTKGDRFLLNVIDSLSDDTMEKGTSIHWHGVYQKGSSWADGPVGVSQCPISPGNSFLYDFTVDDQAGTFWYHSHYAAQYCDGLSGVFVVYDPEDVNRSLYDVDDESTIISLSDWYHTPSPSTGIRPLSNATLINGLGRAAGGPSSPLAVINVEHGKRYRFRLVSLSCDPNFTFSIDGHTMTVIEVDGIDHDPLKVDSIQIFVGQRYSFVLKADRPVDNYWIRANPNNESLAAVGFDGGINSAILRYSGAPIAEPITISSPFSHPLIETKLHPRDDPGAPGGSSPADIAITLEIGLDEAAGIFTLNGQHFVTPNIPVLLQIISGTRRAQELLPSGSIYSLPRNKIVELTIPGGSIGSPHPFHLHGHAFDVVRSAGSSVYNYNNPVRRDVVSTGHLGDNVTIRFKTDNPGPWILHCHIEWHLRMGLAIVFAEDAPRVANETHPPAWDDLCPIFNSLPTVDQ